VRNAAGSIRPRIGSRILLLGGDSDYNVGDRAIVTAVTQCILSHDPAAEISVVAGRSPAIPIPGVSNSIPRGIPGAAALSRAAVWADRILIAGGGLFQDDDSRAKMPYWAARISLLKSLNSRIAGHSLGAGPLQHAESRLAARVACAALTTVSVRDHHAQAALAACTSRRIEVVPDPAFMLEPAPPQDANALLRSLDLTADRPLIVVAARRWFHARGGFVPNVLKARAGMKLVSDAPRLEALLDALSEALVHLGRRLNASILLLPSYNVAHEADDAVCAALARRAGKVTVRLARINDPRLYKAVLGRATLVLSARMHPLILGAGMGVPLVGLSYNSKFEGLFELLGWPAQPLRLDDFPVRWGARELIAAADAALGGGSDLQHRAALLGSTVQRRTVEVAFDDTADTSLETADA
jgi:polysaccharide pyruvyl transferase WcaK-like protein